MLLIVTLESSSVSFNINKIIQKIHNLYHPYVFVCKVNTWSNEERFYKVTACAGSRDPLASTNASISFIDLITKYSIVARTITWTPSTYHCSDDKEKITPIVRNTTMTFRKISAPRIACDTSAPWNDQYNNLQRILVWWQI